MLTCKETTELMSQALDRRLGFVERCRLRLHLLACNGCRNARRQLNFIRDACAAWIKHSD